MSFRANDAVLHAPSGETWVLAADERHGEVVCAGWPESIARAEDCSIVRVSTDEGRLAMLMNVAEHGGLRGSWARDDLRLMGVEPPAVRQGSLFE